MGIANLLSFFLEKYPAPSVCLFVGLIVGMMPSLFREAGEKGRSKGSFISMGIAMVAVFALLLGLQFSSVQITPNFAWYLFCGFCLALSVIAPGYELFHPVNAAGTLYALCRWYRSFKHGGFAPRRLRGTDYSHSFGESRQRSV